jgi:O-antigen/teichoic acid export membrane protein
MAYGWFYALDAGILLLGKTQIHSFIGIVAALVNLTLNTLLIPRYGADGAAWATAMSYGFMPIAMWLPARRISHMRYETIRLFKIAAMTTLLYLVGRLAPTSLSWSLTFAWQLLAILLFVPALFLFQILTPSEITVVRHMSQQFATHWRKLSERSQTENKEQEML